jgi:hypothetical protein
MLPPEVLDLLRQWWKARRRSALVVSRPLTTRSVRAAARNLAVILPISGRISPSTIAGILYVGEARAAFRSSGARQASSYTSNLESEQVIVALKRKGRPCRSIQKTRSQYYQTLEKEVQNESVIATWRKKAQDVWRGGLPCGHYLPEEASSRIAC